MLSQINIVLKQALITFGSKNESLQQNIEILKTLMDKIKAEDVKEIPNLMKSGIWDNPEKAPVTYIDIYQDNNLSFGVFVLKPGMRLPLHNHPDMHGLIKVVAGQVRITSYSFNTERTTLFDSKSTTSIPGYLRHSLVAEKSIEIVADKQNKCCVLYPEDNNLHEIETVGGAAAFVDILAPPYETEIPQFGIRKCSYYKILTEVAPNIFKLKKIGTPVDFWTDTSPYKEEVLL